MSATELRETRPFPPPLVQVLIIDDEPDVRDLIRRVLVHSGLATLEAGSIGEAFAILTARGDGIAAVLTDHRLPGGGAPDVVAWCREHAPGVAVLCMTGSPDLEDIGVPIVRKPFAGRELIAALRSVNVPIRA
jgi:DNA-binding NtrC family response regulator